MDGRRFDDVARALACPRNRRQMLAAWFVTILGVLGFAGARGGRTGAQSCPAEGEPCGLMVPCCPGLACRTLPANPNAGVCGPGSSPSGGGDPSGTRSKGRDGAPTATATPDATSTPAATATATATPTPDDRDGKLAVRVDCLGPVETTEVENTGKVAVTIEKVRSLDPERRSEDREITVDERLEPGKTLRLTSGERAKPGRERLAAYPLYRDGAGGRVVALETTAGTFQATCQARGRGNEGNGGNNPRRATIEVELVCHDVPDLPGLETIGVRNVSTRPVRVLKIRVGNREYKETDAIPPPDGTFLGITLAPQGGEGTSIFFESGPKATLPNTEQNFGPRFLSRTEILDPGTEVEVVTSAGRPVTRKCPPIP